MVIAPQATKKSRAVFLDRDGVLIRGAIVDRKPIAITDGDAVEILEGVPQACAALKAAGFLLVMITNQPDVVRGRTSRAFVDAVNDGLVRTLGLDGAFVCFHDDGEACDCRKPGPGLLLQAARSLNIDLGASVMVGDRWRDVEAGRRAGCRTVLVDYGYDEKRVTPDHTVRSLADAVDWIQAQIRGVYAPAPG